MFCRSNHNRFVVALLLLIGLSAFSLSATAQDSARVYGTVTDQNGNAFPEVRFQLSGTNVGGFTDSAGGFSLNVAPGEHQLWFAVFGYEQERKKFKVSSGGEKKLNVRLRIKNIDLKIFEKVDDSKKHEAGGLYVDPKKARDVVGPIGGIEGMLKTLVGSTNELTAQYSVRGGNYDENLVYVNDFEIYRPFLVRSGQQEGLSFVNPDLTQNVSFSVGGFQAKYGDKMSSVLDVGYKRPTHFAGSANAGLLGGGLHLEGASKNNKITFLFGARQKTNKYLLRSQPVKGIYNPSFTDVQGLVNWNISPRWEMELIGNYARNRFSYLPEEQTASFGVLNKALQLKVFYTGTELDQFDSHFGGYSVTFRPTEKWKLKLLASAFQTNEKETYDINGEYVLGELETDLGKANFGQTKYNLGTGIIQDYARNYLKVNVFTVAHRGSVSLRHNFLQWGADVTRLEINDKLHAYRRRDSAGFTQPFSEDSLTMESLYSASNAITPFRAGGFLQDNFRFGDSSRVTGSFGVRYLYNSLNKEHLVSPRLQLSYALSRKRDWQLRAAAGYYMQPAFYRELRGLSGQTNLNVSAQKSFHMLAGTETNFLVAGKPFKFTTEAYYKNMWDLVPYEYDGIKVRYYGINSSRGYAYGSEFRLYADLVRDATSWISLGVMKTEEQVQVADINSIGLPTGTYSWSKFIPRPTDQRVMVSMFFQDYLPQNDNFRVHLNLMYGTGLPFGYPNGNRVDDVLRMPAYKRVDIGFSALLYDQEKRQAKQPGRKGILRSAWLSGEVFNLLNIQNTLSYIWIQDRTSGKVYAVPNRLTSRLLNVRLYIDF